MEDAKSKKIGTVKASDGKAEVVHVAGDAVSPPSTTEPTLAHFQQVQQNLEAVFNGLWALSMQSKTLQPEQQKEYWIARSAAFEAMETAQIKTLATLNAEGARVFAKVVTATADLKAKVQQAQDVVAMIKVVTASLGVLTSFWSLFTP